MDKITRQIYRHKSIRLKHYDYSQPGSYFVTICARNREPLFGKINDGEMVLSAMGKIVKTCIMDIPAHYPNVALDKFVIMPNHVHAIIVLWGENSRGTACRAPTEEKFGQPKKSSISTIIRSLKSTSTKRINILIHTSGHSIWQRNYYEHVIRNENELNKIRQYIINNPPKWEYDRENRNGIPVDEKKRFWTKYFNEFASESM